jgi:hypothetical protein
MIYDLQHLTGPDDEAVLGPIQDSEALLLFAVCRVICARRVLEFGGLNGYSARNFAAAVGPEGSVYTIDILNVPQVAPNHHPIRKEAKDVMESDVDSMPLDLVFFDCHDFWQMRAAFLRLRVADLISDRTIIAVHDTGLHPYKVHDISRQVVGGWVHVDDERKLVAELCHFHGYDRVSFGALQPLPPLKFRHGLTLLRRRETLE